MPRSSGSPAGLASVVCALVLSLLLGACAITPRVDSADRARIAGKTYVVTGASSGFGRGVALELAAQGANVVLAARRGAVLEELADEVRARGGVPLVQGTDVGKPDDVRRLADAAVARFGSIDVWINDAGVLAVGRFEDIPAEDHARLVQTNLMGVIYGSHVAMRQFRAQGHGVLVNVGSAESVVPLAYQASYAATKAGVLALGRALDQEIRLSDEQDIHVATVLPWAADTPITEHAANYSGHEPRLVSMDDAQTVVNAIVWVSVYPQDALPVGWKSRGVDAMHRVMPGTTENIAADLQHKKQIVDAPPATNTDGALFAPNSAGTEVDGGNREHERRPDAARSPTDVQGVPR
jgi:short-subunit dehydrogenase